jgi:hypothetical protein
MIYISDLALSEIRGLIFLRFENLSFCIRLQNPRETIQDAY